MKRYVCDKVREMIMALTRMNNRLDFSGKAETVNFRTIRSRIHAAGFFIIEISKTNLMLLQICYFLLCFDLYSSYYPSSIGEGPYIEFAVS